MYQIRLFKLSHDLPQKYQISPADTATVKASRRKFLKDSQMTSREYFERTATSLAALNRNELTSRIKNFRGHFRLDFTESYLNDLPVDRLRHILLAALINAGPRS